MSNHETPDDEATQHPAVPSTTPLPPPPNIPPARTARRRKRWVAIAIGAVLVLAAVGALVKALSGDRIKRRDGAIGECLTRAEQEMDPNVDTRTSFVDCAEEHKAEIVGLTEHPASRETPHGQRSRADDRAALSACFALAVDYVGSIFESDLAVMLVTPATPRWADGERTVSCLVIDARDGTQQGSVRSSVSAVGRPEDERLLHDLAVGDCFDVRVTSPKYPYARLVDCSTPHQLESYAAVTLPQEVVEAGGGQWATDQCRERFESFVGVDPAASALRVVPLPPRVNAQGEFFVHCTVGADDGSELAGSMAGTKR